MTITKLDLSDKKLILKLILKTCRNEISFLIYKLLDELNLSNNKHYYLDIDTIDDIQINLILNKIINYI